MYIYIYIEFTLYLFFRRKSRSRSSFDSTTNFDSLAHQGVPNDIFDVDPMDTSLSPDRHQRTRGSSSSVFLHRSRPDLITPRKISPSAASVFEVAASSSPATTASRYREIKYELRKFVFLLFIGISW